MSTPTQPAGAPTVRVDAWVWAVRLMKTRSQATAACRAGHVRLNGERAKPAAQVRVGDEVRVRTETQERIVVVQGLLAKRASAPVAAACYEDHTPPPPPKEFVVPVAVRERGSGRPTKRERRLTDKLRGHGS